MFVPCFVVFRVSLARAVSAVCQSVSTERSFLQTLRVSQPRPAPAATNQLYLSSSARRVQRPIMSKKSAKQKDDQTYDLRDIVLAKIRGFPAWPGIVRSFLSFWSHFADLVHWVAEIAPLFHSTGC